VRQRSRRRTLSAPLDRSAIKNASSLFSRRRPTSVSGDADVRAVDAVVVCRHHAPLPRTEFDEQAPRARSRLRDTSSRNRVIGHEHQSRADGGHENAPDIQPVVVLTAMGWRSGPAAVESDAYLVKPCLPLYLLGVLDALLARAAEP
jgi:hypothetical protein